MLVKVIIPIILSGLLPVLAKAQKNSTRKELEMPKVAAVILKLDGYRDFLAADSNDVWITNVKCVEKLAASRSTPILRVAVPAPGGAMVVGFGSLWVANLTDCSIYRIDRISGKITAIIPTGLAHRYGELSLALGAGSVWVLSDSSGVLTRIAPRNNTVEARIRVKAHSYCAAFGYNSVWVTNSGKAHISDKGEVISQEEGSVQRIDPALNKVVSTIPAGRSPHFLAVGENAVWTLNQGDGTVSRINSRTNVLDTTVDVSIPGTGDDIATGAGRVWIRGTRTLLLSIDPRDNTIIDRYGPPAGSGAIRVSGDNAIWVSAHDIHTVWIIHSKIAKN
jgi:virginiamycin B lyase